MFWFLELFVTILKHILSALGMLLLLLAGAAAVIALLICIFKLYLFIFMYFGWYNLDGMIFFLALFTEFAIAAGIASGCGAYFNPDKVRITE